MLDVNTENLGRHADERAADGGACVPGCPARSRHEPKLRGHEVRGSAHYRAGWDVHGISFVSGCYRRKPSGGWVRDSCELPWSRVRVAKCCANGSVDGDDDLLDQVVSAALDVPRLLERLRV